MTVKELVGTRVKDIASAHKATVESVREAALYWALTHDDFSAESISADFVEALPRGRKAYISMSADELARQVAKLQALLASKQG